MAVVWSWDEKCGDATFVSKRPGSEKEYVTKTNLYTGNACLIFLNEWTDDDGNDMYSMYSFWVDEPHMKNTLGLNPKRGEDNYNYFDTPECRMTEIRINKAKCWQWKKILPALVKAFDNLKIELFTEE